MLLTLSNQHMCLDLRVGKCIATCFGTCMDVRWAELEELHRDWAFWVVNLDKRPDRLACAMQEFNRLGVRVNRLRGIDGTMLDLEQLSFVSPELRPEAVRAQFCRRAALGLTACPVRTLHQAAHTG